MPWPHAHAAVRVSRRRRKGRRFSWPLGAGAASWFGTSSLSGDTARRCELRETRLRLAAARVLDLALDDGSRLTIGLDGRMNAPLCREQGFIGSAPAGPQGRLLPVGPGAAYAVTALPDRWRDRTRGFFRRDALMPAASSAVHGQLDRTGRAFLCQVKARSPPRSRQRLRNRRGCAHQGGAVRHRVLARISAVAMRRLRPVYAADSIVVIPHSSADPSLVAKVSSFSKNVLWSM